MILENSIEGLLSLYYIYAPRSSCLAMRPMIVKMGVQFYSNSCIWSGCFNVLLACRFVMCGIIRCSRVFEILTTSSGISMTFWRLLTKGCLDVTYKDVTGFLD